jgi:hypothetical protein
MRWWRMRNTAIAATRRFDTKPCRPRRETRTVTILESLDFGWTPADIKSFRKMWHGGVPIPEIAKKLRRSELETHLLYLDQRFVEGKIEDREGGWDGGAF